MLVELGHMNALGHIRCTFWLVALCPFASSVPAATAVLPDQRDGQVLEALLLHLLADPHFDRTRVSTNGESIVLNARTPRSYDWHSAVAPDDIGDPRSLSEAESSLRERNAPTDANDKNIPFFKVLSGTVGTVYYTNLTFAAGIVVADLTPTLTGRYGAFKEAHPKARGWVAACLPGYSKDGTRAVVSADVGPSAHGATLTALLEKSGDRWVVKWYHLKLPAMYVRSRRSGSDEEPVRF